MWEKLLEGLNEAQRQAVTHIEGPLLIVAGPGSGKTRVIVHRIAYLVKAVGVHPRRIVAVTFTNKAAREMKERLALLLGPRAGLVSAGTFHALCASILRREGKHLGLEPAFAIYDEDDQASALQRALEEAGLDPRRFGLRAVREAISGAKARLLGPEELSAQANGYFHQVVAQAYAHYQALLWRNRAVDFDDLLLLTYRLFQEHPQVRERYQERTLHLLIDEFQDTNLAQYAIARQLAGRWRNICAVGDPDQSIYSWRHADLRNILTFQHDFPDAQVVRLEENYRSTQAILDAAQKVISANRQRLEKRLFTRRQGGSPPVLHEAYNEEDEARFVVQEVERLVREEGFRYRDIAVMYRVNAQSRALEEACLRYGVPYKLVGALRFYQRREVKDLLAYLRLLLNPQDEVSLLRVVNVPPRGIGRRTLEQLERWALSRSLPLYRALQELASSPEAPLPPTGRTALLRFLALLEGLREASRETPLPDLIDLVAERTGYREYLFQQEDGEERWQNALELRALAQEFSAMAPGEALTSFLERVSLVSDVDNLEEGREGVTLITLHQAKGLEFPVVFIVGLEEGLLPHLRSLDDPSQVEEERRLCYVGMTRAKDRLYLVRAFRRSLMGSAGPARPSRLLLDLLQAQAPLRPAGPARPPPSGPQKPPLKAGDRVRHARFGQGVVVSVVPSGDDQEITVEFEERGLKRLLYSFAPLEKVGEP